VIQGLRNYGYEQDARRIAGEFVRVVSANFQATGDLWEKYNVVDGSIRVINEYDMPAMLGWTAGVFVHCIHFLEQ
jgi:alpha,alpha-trehalase